MTKRGKFSTCASKNKEHETRIYQFMTPSCGIKLDAVLKGTTGATNRYRKTKGFAQTEANHKLKKNVKNENEMHSPLIAASHLSGAGGGKTGHRNRSVRLSLRSMGCCRCCCRCCCCCCCCRRCRFVHLLLSSTKAKRCEWQETNHNLK